MNMVSHNFATTPPGEFTLFAGVGEMRTLMRSHDWSTSPLGPPPSWSTALRTVVNLMLDSKFPMFVAWGPELSFLYNDAYAEILGVKHPVALGRRFEAIWSEIWDVLAPLVQRALAGEATFSKNLPLLMRRKGHDEQTWFTFSYSPVRDENGAIAGMYCACTETTAQMHADRRQAFRLALTDHLRVLSEPQHIIDTMCELLGSHFDLDRAFYAEVDDAAGTFQIKRDWTCGNLPSLAGVSGILHDFGPGIIAHLREGKTLTSNDTHADARAEHYVEAYAGLGLRALLSVPLLKGGRLTATLNLQHSTPHHWRPDEVMLAEEVMQRASAAIDRTYAEAALRESEARLRQLANTIPHLAWMADADGWIHWFNDRWYEYTGTTPEQMTGWGWQSVPDPMCLPAVMDMWRNSIATGDPFECTCPLRGADGGFREFFMRAAPLRDSAGNIVQWFGTNTDVTPLKQAEQAVRESEERLREGVLAARMAVWDWDLVTREIRFSASSHEVLGFSLDGAMPGWDAIHADDVEALRELAAQAIAARGQCETVIRLIRPDNGDTVWLDVRGKVDCDANGVPRYMRGIALDITEREQAQQALRAADRRKDEFLAMLAHELRNPLAPISNAASVMKTAGAELDKAHVRKLSAIIARQAEHMTRLVDDLLDVSRVTRGLVTLARERLAVADIVAVAVEQVRSLIDARGHRLTLRLPAETISVEGDRTRLVQVLANVLNNAAKYTPEGGDILLQVVRDGDQVQVLVRDSGIGIDTALLPHVFDLFTQAERSPDRAQGGLGLGLALVRSLVELHGGSVAAYSDGPGTGSDFTIRLPSAPETPMNPAAPDATRTAGGADGLQLLIVDDNVDAATILAMLTETEGHRSTVCHDGRSALALAPELAPDVCLLDIGLPDMDGYALARRLRALAWREQPVLVALTGYGQPQDREQSALAGFDHHLVKPVDAVRLLGLLRQLMQARGQDKADCDACS